MEPHVYVGTLFLMSAIGHLAMIVTIIGGRVMKPPGRVLVSLYLAINGAVALVLGVRLLGDTELSPEVVGLGYALSTAFFVVTACLTIYGLVRALQGRGRG